MLGLTFKSVRASGVLETLTASCLLGSKRPSCAVLDNEIPSGLCEGLWAVAVQVDI